MKTYFATTTACIILFACVVPSAAQFASSSSGSAVASSQTTTSSQPTSSLDLEDQRAECFYDCYRQYGNYTNCPFGGEDMFMECWCSEEDWIEREEDCVWDVCGVDAYNNYADIYRRMCQTVQVPETSGRTPTWPLSTTISEESQSSPTTSVTSSTESASDDSSTSPTPSPSPTSEDAAEESEDPNGGGRLLVPSAATAGMVVGIAYLVRAIL